MPARNKGLPALSEAARLRAIKKHCKSDHPKETPRSLYRRLASRPKETNGVSKHETAKHQAARQAKHGTRDIVTFISQHDPRLSSRGRGSVVFCRVCLFRLNSPDAQRSFICKQRLAMITTEGVLRTKKRQWWLRLKEGRPEFTKDLLEALGLTQAEVDALLGLKPEDTCASLGFKATRAVAKPFRKPKTTVYKDC